MLLSNIKRSLYKQGQYNGKIREYFYFVNHQGYLFLDDSRMKNFTSAYKDVDFLNFFYKMLKVNKTGRYEDSFPYVSKCGIERNYLKCDDTPIVFTEINDKGSQLKIGQSQIMHDFQPNKIKMDERGRVYHPYIIGDMGLVSDKLTDKIYNCFEFDRNNNPVAFNWKDHKYILE